MAKNTGTRQTYPKGKKSATTRSNAGYPKTIAPSHPMQSNDLNKAKTGPVKTGC